MRRIRLALLLALLLAAPGCRTARSVGRVVLGAALVTGAAILESEIRDDCGHDRCHCHR